jgi:hypothetical protein
MSTTWFWGKRKPGATHRVLLRVTILIITRGTVYLGGWSSVSYSVSECGIGHCDGNRLEERWKDGNKKRV